jgi:hypothetical protein
MELPSDIYAQLVQYFTAKDLLMFRVTMKINMEHAKRFEGDMTRVMGSISLWKSAFPQAKCINIRGNYNVVSDDFKYLDMVETLDMSLCCPIMSCDSFLKLPNLKNLNLQGCVQTELSFRDDIFISLSGLITLYMDNNYGITDDALSYMPLLEDLTIHSCFHITDYGIRKLKKLKRLDLYNQRFITNDVFKGLELETLKIYRMKHITDEGILQLSHLKKLTTSYSHNIMGYGYNTLTHLKELFLSDVLIKEDQLRSFVNIRDLTFYSCTILGDCYEVLKELVQFYVYESEFMIPSSLKKLAKLPKLNLCAIYRCNLSPEIESQLRWIVFG